MTTLVNDHPAGNLGANLKSISCRCYLREVAFEWELTKETIYVPLGCLQSGLEAVQLPMLPDIYVALGRQRVLC